MSTATEARISDGLQKLILSLETYTGRIPLNELTHIVGTADLSLADVSAFVRLAPDHYQDTLVCRREHFEIRSLGWQSGQRSSIHDHYGSSCVVRMMKGKLRNTDFECNGAGFVRATRSNDLKCGQVNAKQDDEIHQLVNENPDDAVSLHIYSPPLGETNVFDETGVTIFKGDQMEKQRDSIRPAEHDRRIFLGGLAAGAIAQTSTTFAAEPQRGDQANAAGAFPGVISRQRNPDNLEFPFPTLRSFLTPNEQFYVRTHFDVPEINAKTWRLRVEGAVERPLDINYDELCKLQTRTVTSLLECSGNSRVFLKPPQVSIRWEQGAVSNAEWTGVPLSAVLEQAGVKDGAIEVILEGADRGRFDPPEPKTPGVIHYARSLPLQKARRPEVLLAYQMNGRELPVNHGFPVRVVVPGWYGMASVKWLKRIIVVDRPFHGFFQTFMYTTWERRNGLPDLVPVTEMQVKAQVARPTLNEIIRAGSTYRVFGAAWAGEADVTNVEVSTDGGGHWAEARLLDRSVRHAWRFWEYEWSVPKQAGRCTVMARATDSRKRVQPMERDEDRRDAVISHVQPIQIEVR